MPVVGRRGGTGEWRRIVGPGSGQAPVPTVSAVSAVPVVAFLLLESGSSLLLESGDKPRIET